MKSALTRAIERTERAKREELCNEHYRNCGDPAGVNPVNRGHADMREDVTRAGVLLAARKARADILEWEAAELESRALTLRANASKIRSEAHAAK